MTAQEIYATTPAHPCTESLLYDRKQSRVGTASATVIGLNMLINYFM